MLCEKSIRSMNQGSLVSLADHACVRNCQCSYVHMRALREYACPCAYICLNKRAITRTGSGALGWGRAGAGCDRWPLESVLSPLSRQARQARLEQRWVSSRALLVDYWELQRHWSPGARPGARSGARRVCSRACWIRYWQLQRHWSRWKQETTVASHPEWHLESQNAPQLRASAPSHRSWRTNTLLPCSHHPHCPLRKATHCSVGVTGTAPAALPA